MKTREFKRGDTVWIVGSSISGSNEFKTQKGIIEDDAEDLCGVRFPNGRYAGYFTKNLSHVPCLKITVRRK